MMLCSSISNQRSALAKLVSNAVKSASWTANCHLSMRSCVQRVQQPSCSAQMSSSRRFYSSDPVQTSAGTVAASGAGSETSAPAAHSQQPIRDLFYIEDHKDKGYITLKLNKTPVNSLNLEFLTELNILLDKLEEAKDFKGVVLTSNIANIFSAGLDIMEMYQCKQDRVKQFWSALQDFWLKLYGSNKIFIAAINGHSPAGGCLIAMSCDYRIMAKGPYKIGLNETLLGIEAPFWFRDTIINTVGFREAEKALQLGRLFSAEEALAINMVDEICEPKELMARAEQQMQIWGRIPTVARELTKTSMRRNTLNKLISRKASDIEDFATFITREFIQKSLHAYLESLKKPKAK